MKHQFPKAKKSNEWAMKLHGGRKIAVAAHLYGIKHELSDFLLLLEPKSLLPIAEGDIAIAWKMAAHDLDLVNRPYSVMLWEWSRRMGSYTLYLVTETWNRELVTTPLLRMDENGVRIFPAGAKWGDAFLVLGLLAWNPETASAHK